MSIIPMLSISEIIILSCAYAMFSFFLREGFILLLLGLLLPSMNINGIRVLFWLILIVLGLMLCALCWLLVLIRKSRANLIILGVSVIVLRVSLSICPSLSVWDKMVSGGARPYSLQEQFRIRLY